MASVGWVEWAGCVGCVEWVGLVEEWRAIMMEKVVAMKRKLSLVDIIVCEGSVGVGCGRCGICGVEWSHWSGDCGVNGVNGELEQELVSWSSSGCRLVSLGVAWSSFFSSRGW